MTYVEVKHGRQPPAKIHPAVDDVLQETYGVMVYQEQVMRIINRLGGIELPKAYACIKAISKKKAETIEKNRAEFIRGAVERGMAEDTARDLFGLIEKFAGYGFNKSHSTAYAAIAYQTAYLKANYPVEFMAALLSCGMEDSERISEHVDDCRRQKIEVLRPDVNHSDVEFTCAGDKILFGLGAIRGVGDAPVRAIMEERQQNGPFKDIFELCERVDPKLMSKGVLELLIKAGALDAFGPNRAQHLEAIERAIGNAASRFRDKQSGQKNLFGGDEDEAGVETGQKPIFPPLADLPQSQKLQAEKEVLGFYLTSHPLSQHEKVLKSIASHTTADLHALPDGAQVLIGGMISAIKRTQTKKPSRNGHSRYANFDFEDVQGVVRCIMWPEEFARLGEHVENETICFLEGKVDRRGREPNLIVGDLIPLDQAEKKYAEQVAIKFDTKWHNEATVEQAKNLLKQFPGKCSVAFVVDTNDEGKPVRVTLSVPSNVKVSADPRLREELTRFLGEGCMHVAYPRKRINGNGNGQRRIDLGEG
jgi:DNA polymerase III subunit alpha